MDVLALKKDSLISFITKIESEKLGLCFSFLIHFIILLFAIGLPNFFERAPINVPTIIPIEIIIEDKQKFDNHIIRYVENHKRNN